MFTLIQNMNAVSDKTEHIVENVLPDLGLGLLISFGNLINKNAGSSANDIREVANQKNSIPFDISF